MRNFGSNQRCNRGAFRSVTRPEIRSYKVMVVVVNSGHGCRYHFPFKTGETPSFGSQFDNTLYCDFDTFFFSGVGKVFDSIHNLFNHGAGSCVNALLSSTTCKCREKCLLAPYGLFASALVAYVVAH